MIGHLTGLVLLQSKCTVGSSFDSIVTLLVTMQPIGYMRSALQQIHKTNFAADFPAEILRPMKHGVELLATLGGIRLPY